MHTRDYEAIAAIIAGDLACAKSEKARYMLNGSDNDSYVAGRAVGSFFAIRNLALSLADHMKQDNPRFERSVFLDACGLGDVGVTRS